MAVPVRPIATTGVALAAAGVIAFVPSAPPALLAAAPPSPAIQLTASEPIDPAEDPLTAWLTTFNNTQTGGAALSNSWGAAPFPVIQQILANWIGYAGVVGDPGEIINDIVDNFHAATNSIVATNTDTLDLQHTLIFTALEGVISADPDLAFLQPVVEYTTTYSSGIMLGVLGTFLSPWLATGDALHAFADNLTTDPGAAFNSLVNVPAVWLNGFFNGYGEIDLSSLSPALEELLSEQFGRQVDIPAFAIVLGGLLSGAGTPSGDTTKAVAGGSFLQAVTLHATTPGPFGTTIPLITANGTPVGPLAAFVNQGKVQAKAIGWDGDGNPLAPPLPPPTEEEEGEEEAPVEEAPEGEEGEGEALAALSSAVDEDSEGDDGDASGVEIDEDEIEEMVDEAEEAAEAAEESSDGETGENDGADTDDDGETASDDDSGDGDGDGDGDDSEE